ncbi:MAG: type II toxin-antitoxin system HicA family toxin [Kribbellaceae bacterium]|nr:type II toxin-antitoxin system HicA family toxin [Kribbellaceae bacterium]
MAAPKKRREAERELRKKGFEPVKGRGKGSHEVWQDANGKSVVVPKHGDEIAAGTWRSIERQANSPSQNAQASSDTQAAQRAANSGVAPPGKKGRGSGQQQGQSGQGQQQQKPAKRRLFGGRDGR